MLKTNKIIIKKLNQKIHGKHDHIVVDNLLGDIPNIQNYFQYLSVHLGKNGTLIAKHTIHIWEPILSVLAFLGIKNKMRYKNWIDQGDISNLLNLSGFEVVGIQRQVFGSKTIAKLKYKNGNINNKFSVSIVIPARNEAGNIKNILPSIPNFGKLQEIIFVEGNSTDKTWSEIKKLKNVTAFKQAGTGKKDAVLLGLSKAKGDILMIYDADRTIEAKELTKFYNVLASGLGEFANGSRMIYPMDVQAMRTLNKIGNKVFSILFSWILGQRFKDTLCGTKAFFRKDYLDFKFTKDDPFGDFDLIFGAIRSNLKVIEVPVRYKVREYGETNIHRFKNGLTLFKMTFLAFKEFKLSPQQNTQ